MVIWRRRGREGGQRVWGKVNAKGKIGYETEEEDE